MLLQISRSFIRCSMCLKWLSFSLTAILSRSCVFDFIFRSGLQCTLRIDEMLLLSNSVELGHVVVDLIFSLSSKGQVKMNQIWGRWWPRSKPFSFKVTNLQNSHPTADLLCAGRVVRHNVPEILSDVKTGDLVKGKVLINAMQASPLPTLIRRSHWKGY